MNTFCPPNCTVDLGGGPCFEIVKEIFGATALGSTGEDSEDFAFGGGATTLGFDLGFDLTLM